MRNGNQIMVPEPLGNSSLPKEWEPVIDATKLSVTKISPSGCLANLLEDHSGRIDALIVKLPKWVATSALNQFMLLKADKLDKAEALQLPIWPHQASPHVDTNPWWCLRIRIRHSLGTLKIARWEAVSKHGDWFRGPSTNSFLIVFPNGGAEFRPWSVGEIGWMHI